jgi:hypothetical protein
LAASQYSIAPPVGAPGALFRFCHNTAVFQLNSKFLDLRVSLGYRWSARGLIKRKDPMIRRFKILMLAFSAVLAMAVASVPAASAQTAVGTSDGPVTGKGTQTGTELANSLTFTIFGSSFQYTCPGSTYTGHKIDSTPHQLIPSGSTKATLTANWVNCTDGTHPLIVSMNGCDFVVRNGVTTGGVVGTYGGLVDVVCPAGKVIEITGGTCKVTIPAQMGLTGLHVTATGTDWVLAGSAEGGTMTVCGFNTKGTTHADVTIKSYNSAGAETAVTISE